MRLEEVTAYAGLVHAQAADLGEQLNVLAGLYAAAKQISRDQVNRLVAAEREKRKQRSPEP